MALLINFKTKHPINSCYLDPDKLTLFLLVKMSENLGKKRAVYCI